MQEFKAGSMENGIVAQNVSKTFYAPEPVLALKDANIREARGEFVSILGPSGCGKSTLLRMIAGLIDSDSPGEITILEHKQSYKSMSDDVGVVFQTHNMLPWSTVEENIRLAAEVRGLPK